MNTGEEQEEDYEFEPATPAEAPVIEPASEPILEPVPA